MQFSVGEDDSVHQVTSFVFSEPVSGTLNYTMPGSARDVSVSDGRRPLDFTLVRTDGSYFLSISAPEPATS